MKFLVIAFAFLASFASAQDDVCYDSVITACSASGNRESFACNSVYGGIEHSRSDLQAYANEQLAASYEYLLLGTHFNSYQKNRPGFQKLFQGLSDKAFDKGIELIKHISKRGGAHDFNQKIDQKIVNKPKKLEVDEMYALALALDQEKKLSTDAMRLHRRVSHIDRAERYEVQKHYDPEISQFLEEEFIEYQSDIVRKLSGYANDLSKLVRTEDPSLALYLFDDYLAKQ